MIGWRLSKKGNQTLELVQLLKDKKVIDYKWVYKKKEASSIREPIKYNARLVTKGEKKS